MTVCLQEYSFVASALSHYDVLKYASVRHGLSASLSSWIQTVIARFQFC